MKLFAICDIEGYCFVSSVDGGMNGDPKLRVWFDCPLGRTTRHVLHVLLGACKKFGDKIDGSGVYIAMDNYFTSPTLFECLASHDIFAVGTCRSNRTGGAVPYLQSLDRRPVERGEMHFARAGNVAFVQWLDSKEIILCSSIHIAQPHAAIGEPKKEDSDGGDDHFAPLPYRCFVCPLPSRPHPFMFSLRKAGQAGKSLELQQPWMRKDYVANMGGVDTADQQNGSHTHDHKSYTNHWRRVMEGKFEQTFTNIFVMFKKYVSLLEDEANKRIKGGGLELEVVEKLDRVLVELGRLAKMERAVWDEMLSTELMARCNVGRPNKGGRPAAVTGAPDKVWGSISVKTQRKCMHPGCKSKTSKGCACAELCVGKQAGDRGVLMCQTCFNNPVRHARAGDAHRNPHKYGVVGRKDLVWWS
ncbi:unnamed protein product [Ectocarpus sp. CCAP 1310/34]|nr:unnamed protein product [Ectocarpus sp. CCAP 1310/34]